MRSSQKKAINYCVDELCDALSPELFLLYLRTINILSITEVHYIERSLTDRLRIFATFDFLKEKPDGWKAIFEFLRSNKFIQLADRLEKIEHESRDGSEILTPSAVQIQDPLVS